MLHDTTVGIAVYDRETEAFTEGVMPDLAFRSASIVKLLIALDFLWEGTAGDLDDEDRSRLDPMLRSSDDPAATYYWKRNGQSEIVDRMADRLGLTGTAGPPDGFPGYWGYTAITPNDTIRIYRYLLDEAPASVGDFILGNLAQATRHGIDGYDQYFGIASAFERPWRVKQGWSGFGTTGQPPDPTEPDRVDLTRHVLHTTGTVGADDRAIVALYGLYPVGTDYEDAYADLTERVGRLDVPGAVRRKVSPQ